MKCYNYEHNSKYGRLVHINLRGHLNANTWYSGVSLFSAPAAEWLWETNFDSCGIWWYSGNYNNAAEFNIGYNGQYHVFAWNGPTDIDTTKAITFGISLSYIATS